MSHISSNQPIISGKTPIIKFKTLGNIEKNPCKTGSDACWDIHIVSLISGPTDDNPTIYYGTSLCFEPPQGHHLLVFNRSSLHKFGYTLATGVSVIDEGYRGELVIPLVKLWKEAKPLPLPFKAVQIRLEKSVDGLVAKCQELSESSRGTGSFGSTGY